MQNQITPVYGQQQAFVQPGAIDPYTGQPLGMQNQQQFYPQGFPQQQQPMGFGNNMNMMNLQMQNMGQNMGMMGNPVDPQMQLMLSAQNMLLLYGQVPNFQVLFAQYPILQQNFNNPFVQKNVIMASSARFFEAMKYNLVQEQHIQEFANILQKPLLSSMGQIVYPNLVFSRMPMDMKCTSCGKEGQTTIAYSWGCGNTCCCLQLILIPFSGLILGCIFNCCTNQFDNATHKCPHCKAVLGQRDVTVADVCICVCNKPSMAKSVDDEPLQVYRGKGVDAFVGAQEWPIPQQVRSRGGGRHHYHHHHRR